MKVALLHYAAHPVVGGVENVIRAHSRLLARAGHKVLIIAGRGAQVDPEVEFASLPLIDSRSPEILAFKDALDAGSVPEGFHALAATIEVQLRQALSGFDWVFAHNVCSLNKNLAATCALRRIADDSSPKLALWHHDLAWTTPRYRAQLHEGTPWNLLRNAWPKVLQVTVSTSRQHEIAELFGIPAQTIRVVPNGIDPISFLDIGAETAEMADGLGLLRANPLLLLPARVTPRKNIELAIRTLDHLRHRFPGAILLITGPVGAHDGGNQAYLESLVQLGQSLGIEDRVVFLARRASGALSDRAIRELYRLADALFLPSREEGFGIPILEAGLARIPVFCSGISSLKELGGDEATYFAPDDDAASVARQIGDALSADRRGALRRRILRENTWERIYEEHLAPFLSEHSK